MPASIEAGGGIFLEQRWGKSDKFEEDLKGLPHRDDL
jgi:hypothetical protein